MRSFLSLRERWNRILDSRKKQLLLVFILLARVRQQADFNYTMIYDEIETSGSICYISTFLDCMSAHSLLWGNNAM